MGNDALPPRMTAATRLGLDRLKEASFGDFITVRMPDRWRCTWHEEEDAWTCADRDADSATIGIGYTHFEPAADHLSDLSWLEEMHEMIPAILSKIGQPPSDSTAVVARDASHTVVRCVETDPEFQPDDDPVRVVTWHHFGFRRPYVILVQLNLVIPVYALQFDETRRLLALMEEELLRPRIDWDAFRPGAETGLTMGADDLPPRVTAATGLGLDRFREATFEGFVTVRIPERWKIRRRRDGGWECADREADSATMHVGHKCFEPPAGHLSDETWLKEMRAMAPAILPASERGPEPPGLTDLGPLHMAARCVSTVTEKGSDGEHGQMAVWYHFGFRRPYVIIVRLALIIPLYALEFDETRRLLALMEEELLRPRIDWDAFRPSTEED